MERMLKHHGEEGFYSVVLDHQYRMNQEICALSSSLFYNNRLVCANQGVAESVIRANLRENVENVFPGNYLYTTPLRTVVSETMWKVLSSKMEDSVVFIDTYSKKSNSEFASAFSVATKSRFNAGEANFVVNLCKTLMSVSRICQLLKLFSEWSICQRNRNYFSLQGSSRFYHEEVKGTVTELYSRVQYYRQFPRKRQGRHHLVLGRWRSRRQTEVP